jgi:hypothetical protein
VLVISKLDRETSTWQQHEIVQSEGLLTLPFLQC